MNQLTSDEEVAWRIRHLLAGHGYTRHWRAEDAQLLEKRRLQASARSRRYTVALLADSQEQVLLWRELLSSSNDAAVANAWPCDQVHLQVQSCHEPLPCVVDDIHLFDVAGIAEPVLGHLAGQCGRLNLHSLSPLQDMPRPLFQWRSQEVLAAFLRGLVSCLKGQTWPRLDLSRHIGEHHQASAFLGFSARGPRLLKLLSDLQEQVGDAASRANSALLLVDASAGFTLGDYFEACQWLETWLPGVDLRQACVLGGQSEELQLALLLNIP